jgi:hypothetical protein
MFCIQVLCTLCIDSLLPINPFAAQSDTMLLKLQNDLCYFLGLSFRMRDGVARALPFLLQDTTPMYSYVLGMYAFALEESFQYPQVAIVLIELSLC